MQNNNSGHMIHWTYHGTGALMHKERKEVDLPMYGLRTFLLVASDKSKDLWNMNSGEDETSRLIGSSSAQGHQEYGYVQGDGAEEEDEDTTADVPGAPKDDRLEYVKQLDL